MTTPIINIQSKLLAPNNVAQFRQQLQNAVKGVSANVSINISKGATGNLNKLSAAAQKLSNNLNTLNQTASRTTSILGSIGNLGNFNNLTSQIRSLQSSINSLPKTVNSAKAAINNMNSAAAGSAQNVNKATSQFNNMASAATKIVNPTNRAANNINSFSKSLGSTNTSLKTTSIQLELTARRFLAFAAVSRPIIAINQAFEKGVQEAIKYQKELVTLKQVGGDTSAVIDGLSNKVRSLATGLGVSSGDLIKTANVLRQAGLSINDINKSLDALAKTTLAPNFDDLTETVEGFIAVNSQFGGSIDETIKSLSRINTVASAYPVESADLITSVQKTGAAFKAAGGSIEELIGTVTAVRSTTRESADTIATGLRTIIARTQRLGTITELKQFGIDITANAEQAKRLGVAVGDILPVFERFRVISQGVSGFSESDPRFAQIIELVGGIRQLSKTIPLLKEFNKAQEATNLAIIGGNSLNRDAETAQKSLSVQLTKLTEGFNKLFDTFGRNESVRQFISSMIQLTDISIKAVEALEPIAPILLSIAAAGAIQVGSGLLGSLKNGIPVNIRQNQIARPVRRNRGGVIPGPNVNKDVIPAIVGKDDYILRKSATQALDLNGGIENILAMLTPGEYHIPAPQARKIGYGNLERLNKIGTSSSFRNNEKIQSLLERIRKEDNPGVRYALKRNYISLGGDPTFIKGYAKGGRVRDVAAQLGIGLDVLKSVASDYGIPLPKDSKGRFGASAKIDDALATRIENALRFSSQVIDAPIKTNQLPVYQSARKPSQFEQNLSKEARRRAENTYRTYRQTFNPSDYAATYSYDRPTRQGRQFEGAQPNLTGVDITTQRNIDRAERIRRNAERTGFSSVSDRVIASGSKSAIITSTDKVVEDLYNNIYEGVAKGLETAAKHKNIEAQRRAQNAARVNASAYAVGTFVASTSGNELLRDNQATPEALAQRNSYFQFKNIADDKTKSDRQAQIIAQRRAANIARAGYGSTGNVFVAGSDGLRPSPNIIADQSNPAIEQAIFDHMRDLRRKASINDLRGGTPEEIIAARRAANAARTGFNPNPTGIIQSGPNGNRFYTRRDYLRQGFRTVRSDIRGGLGNFFGGISNSNQRLERTIPGRAISNPLTGIGLGLAGQYAASRGGPDNQIMAGVSGGLIGAGGGAALGSFGGPWGAAIGAVIGGLTGLVTSLRDFNEKIAQSKFDKSLSNFSAQLNSINIGSDGISAGEAKSIDQLITTIKQESERRFGGDFEGRQQFASEQFGGLGLDKILSQIIEKNNIGSVDELRKFQNGSGGRFIGAIAQGNRTDQASIEKAYERIIASNLDMKKVKAATENFARAVDDTAEMFATLSRAIDSTISDYERNSDNLSRFTAIDGSRFDAGSITNRGFAGRAQIVANTLGPQGAQLANQALGFNTLKSALPGIIRGIVSNTSDPATLEARFGESINAMQGVPDNVKSRFINAFDTISEDLIKNGIGGVEEAVRNLADNSFPGLEDAVNQYTDAIEKQLSSFADGLITVRNFTTQIRDLKVNRVELQGGRNRNRLEAFGFNPVFGQVNTFAARQNTLTGGAIGAYNVGGIANALRDTQNQINTEQKRAADTGDVSLETTKKISDLRYRAEDLGTALRNLTDVTLTTADAQERLAAIEGEKNARLGFSEQVLRNSPFQNAQLQTTAEMARIATFTGLEAFDTTSINKILDFFQQLGDVTFENGLTGNKIAENLIGNTSVGFANRVPQLAQQALGERGQIDKAFGVAQQATEALKTELTLNSGDFFNQLVKTNNDFLNGLKETLVNSAREEKQKQIAGVQGQVNANSTIANSIKNFQDRGINVQAAASLVGNGSIKNLLEKRDSLGNIATQFNDINSNIPRFPVFRTIDKVTRGRLDKSIGGYLAEKGFAPEEIKSTLDTTQKNFNSAPIGTSFNSILKAAIDEVRNARINQAGFAEGFRETAAKGNIDANQLQKILSLPEEDRNALNKVAEAIQSAGGKIEQFTNKAANDAARLDELKARGFATGGYVHGRGNKDSINARLMPGEFVMNRNATKRNLGYLQSINSGANKQKTLKQTIDDVVNTAIPINTFPAFNKPTNTQQDELIETLQRRRTRNARRARQGISARQFIYGQQNPISARQFLYGSDQPMTARQFFYGAQGRPMSAREFLTNSAYFADGGSVFKPRGSDVVPAMLTPGEFIVNAGATKKFLPTLKQMNAQYRADGGVINSSSGTGSLNLNDFGRDLIKPLNDFTQSFALMGKVFSEMNSKMGELANSLSNLTMKVEGKQTVEVIVNGSKVLAAITPEVRSIVNDAIKEAINAKFNDDKFNGIPN